MAKLRTGAPVEMWRGIVRQSENAETTKKSVTPEKPKKTMGVNQAGVGRLGTGE